MGNLRSVQQALLMVAPDATVVVTGDPREVALAQRVVFPGQGAMPDCMREMDALGLTPDAFTGNVANLGSAPILVHRCFPFPKQVRWSADQPIGNLRIQVYDSEGYLLTTGDGLTGTSQTAYYDADMGDWNMNLLVSEV